MPPPENSDNTPIQPSAQPPQEAGINPQQAPPPQFPPFNAPQNTTPTISTTPPKKTFPTKKLIIVIAALFIIFGLVGSGIFLYQKFTNKAVTDQTKTNQPVQTENKNSEIKESTATNLLTISEVDLSSCVTMNDPKMFPDQLGEFTKLSPNKPLLSDKFSYGKYTNLQKYSKELGNTSILEISVKLGDSQGIKENLEKSLSMNPSQLEEAIKKQEKDLGIKDVIAEIEQTSDAKLLISGDKREINSPTGQVYQQQHMSIRTFLEKTNFLFTFELTEGAESLKSSKDFANDVKSLFNEWVTKVCQPK